MRKPFRLIGFFAVCAVLLLPLGALADSISPISITGWANPGVSINIQKFVFVDAASPPSSYSRVSLDFSEVPAAITASYGGGISGAFDRSILRSFDLGQVEFTLNALGIYDFNVYALVDSTRVATEHDIFYVTAVPVPPSLLLLGSALMGLAGWRRFRKS